MLIHDSLSVQEAKIEFDWFSVRLQSMMVQEYQAELEMLASKLNRPTLLSIARMIQFIYPELPFLYRGLSDE